MADHTRAAIPSEAGAASSVYDFLVDLMSAERAMGMFYILADEAGREALFERAEAYYERIQTAP